MCGISGIKSLNSHPVQNLEKKIKVMNQLIAHRGPDGEGIWTSKNQSTGFGHKRLSILDLEHGHQPMTDDVGFSICFNGEIYNYLELKKELSDYRFKTASDTEVVLAAYQKWGKDCLNKFRGMFAFAIWDEKNQTLFCARDQFGIKPFYYSVVDNEFFFCSEVKGLLPFLPQIETDLHTLKEYLVFQIYLSERTLFKGVYQLDPGHYLTIKNGNVSVQRYWEIHYDLDFNHTRKYFEEKLRHLIEESVNIHTRSDVPIGAYISGGFDSGIVAAAAKKFKNNELVAFTGKFAAEGELFDESRYARDLAGKHGIELYERDITSQDFVSHIEKVIYHLDYPVAGPGAFAQYCVSELASKHRKVVLGGQGGDEIFGGYTRYLIAYFEQCIKAAIEGTLQNGNFVVTYESIIGNLQALNTYKPMMQEFFSEGMFGPLDRRYFRLVNRAPHLGDEINWQALNGYDPFESFSRIFNGKNVGKESYFDKMSHFDFKTLLPGLLQVEDRMSMAWGLESRVPLIDPKIVEFAATMPADIKFKDGTLKMILVDTMKDLIPDSIVSRKNKMGFPVPLNKWMKADVKDFVTDIFTTEKSSTRGYIDNKKVMDKMTKESQFGRTVWGLLSLEIWHQQFHDKNAYYKNLIKF
jgi:asparagine synthase (glutamine-hydrolysing)